MASINIIATFVLSAVVCVQSCSPMYKDCGKLVVQINIRVFFSCGAVDRKRSRTASKCLQGSVKGKVISVSYNGTCIDKKVMLKQKTYAGITIEFQSNEVTPTLKTVVHGVVAGVSIPFPVGNPDACKDSNVTCPLQSGKTYTYSSVIYVSPSYPQITVVVKWELQDKDGKDEVCIALPAEITK
ncbi:hypothetical protein BaRGS_00020080 [Batillaria attramentaria]|uniref:MD-2-related lipid-recognition domain-containing protein n=1 Tax=Batillaria attramentaria TaxID=370345 RepID=A0ABD0KN64_9CAEN